MRWRIAVVVVGHAVGESDGHVGGVGVELSEDGEDVVSESGAGAGEVVVGDVLAVGLFEGSEEVKGLGVVGGEHGSDEGDGGGGGGGEGSCPCDAAEAGGACAAEESHKEGFELVIGVVSGGDEGVAVLLGEMCEGGVAELACVGFEVAWGLIGVDVGSVEGQVEVVGELGDPLCVMLGGGAAEVVLDVGDGELEPPAASIGEECDGAEESDRVGSAADGEEEGVALADAAASAEASGDAADEGVVAEAGIGRWGGEGWGIGRWGIGSWRVGGWVADHVDGRVCCVGGLVACRVADDVRHVQFRVVREPGGGAGVGVVV